MSSRSDTDGNIETVICVPGHWQSVDEFRTRLSSTGYEYSDGQLRSPDDDFAADLIMERPDPRLRDAFRVAGRHWVTAADEAAISMHTLVLYQVVDGAGPELAIACMRASAALIQAGGYAVKIESSGIAHSAETWLELTRNSHLYSAHQAFVVYVTGDETYSCGMHVLGLADAIVDSGDSADAAELLRVFTHYVYAEQPTIQTGQTFSAGPEEPVYRLTHQLSDLYDADDLFHNPQGLWRLTPVDR